MAQDMKLKEQKIDQAEKAEKDLWVSSACSMTDEYTSAVGDSSSDSTLKIMAECTGR